MGKASKWFRSILLLGFKKQDNNPSPNSHSQTTPTSEKKKRWNFVKSYREKECHHHIQRSSLTAGFSLSVTDDNVVVDNNGDDDDDTKKHAMAVAEATKAVAEAAVAAAEAAAAVVRLTSSGRAISITSSTNNTTAFVPAKSASGYEDKEIWAAVIIQSHFRAYLSRRALRALKALVRLQARFRGHIVRKDNANRLRRMQAMVRAQVRARTATNNAQQHFDSPLKSNQFNHSGPATPEKFEHLFRARSMKHGENLIYRSNGNMNNYCKTRMGSSNWMDTETEALTSWEQINQRAEEKSDRILEVVLDNGKSQSAAVVRRRRRNLFHSCHLSLGSSEQCCSHSFTTSKDSAGGGGGVGVGVGGGLSPSSGEVQSFFSPMKFCEDVVDEEGSYYAAADGGGTNNNRGGGTFTPTKSDCSRSGYSEYYYPSYMANTESSKAKIRSLSAPKQRPSYEKTSPNIKRYSIYGYDYPRTTTTTGMQQKISSLHANFTNKVYPGSGRLDRLGLPVTEELISFSGGHWHHRC